MKNFIPYIWLLVFGTACNSTETSTEAGAKSPATPDTTTTVEAPKPEPLVAADPIFHQTALFLAGLPQVDSCIFSALQAKPFWQEHAAEMEKLWSKAEELRLNTLKQWRETELSPQIIDTLPLYYPFSGPDFLHAWFFYPQAPSYHMIALEPVVLFPEWNKMSDIQMKSYLANLRTSLRDVIGKSYFITVHMMKDLKAGEYSGVLPVYYVFLARTGHSILNTETIRLDENGTQIADNVDYYGLRLSMTADGYKEKTITYMRYDLSDKNLAAHPEFAQWVDGMGPKNVFVKAASYLMHYRGFDSVRKTVSTNTMSIFQDDTGLPLKHMDTTSFSLKLYGAYTRPIKDFSDATYQSDLKALYDKTPKDEIGTIPFPLGYHVVGDKIQNHQVLIKK